MPVPVALTGGTGFIGRALLERLRREGYSVRALTRHRRPDEPGVEWIPGDVTRKSSLPRLVEGVAAVVHCAGATRGTSARHFEQINAAGTQNLVEAAAAVRPAPRFLLISSLAARAPQLSWYAASKRLAEERLAGHAGSLPWTVFRPTAVYGPGDREIGPLLKVMRHGLLPVVGNPRSRFSLLYLDDLVQAVLAWLRAPRVPRSTFELDDGTPGGYDWQLILDIARRRWNRRIRMVRVPLPVLQCCAFANLWYSRVSGRVPMLTPGKVRELTHGDWVCNNAALTAVLGWKPATVFEDALGQDSLLALEDRKRA